MKIYILAPLHEAGVDWLKERAEVITYDDPRVSHWHEDADGIIVRYNAVSREDMENAPKLKCISKHGIGTDVIDLKCAKERGITVCNTPEESVESVAEQAVALMLAVSRRTIITDRMVHEGKVPHGKIPVHDVRIGTELYGKTVGLVGFGRIAIATGEILHKGFKMKVKAYAPNVRTLRWAAADYGVQYCNTMEELVEDCDFISCHLPINEKTRDTVDAHILSLCKPTAIVINTGRGGVVNEKALYDALVNGQIAGAASDVFEEEPPNPNNPLFTLPNFVATPHMGVNTIDALIRQSVSSCRNVYDVLTGKKVDSIIV